jgi:hypothetical protein
MTNLTQSTVHGLHNMLTTDVICQQMIRQCAGLGSNIPGTSSCHLQNIFTMPNFPGPQLTLTVLPLFVIITDSLTCVSIYIQIHSDCWLPLEWQWTEPKLGTACVKDSLIMAPQECRNMKQRKFCNKCVWPDGLKPAIGPYCKPNKLWNLSSLFLHNPLNILFTAKLRVFQVDSFLQISPQIPVYISHFPICATQPTYPLLREWISLTISGDESDYGYKP